MPSVAAPAQVPMRTDTTDAGRLAAARKTDAQRKLQEQLDSYWYLADIAPAPGSKRDGESRMLAHDSKGNFSLLRHIGTTLSEAGPATTFKEARDLAVAVLAGEQLIVTHPHTLFKIALGLVGAHCLKLTREASTSEPADVAQGEDGRNAHRAECASSTRRRLAPRPCGPNGSADASGEEGEPAEGAEGATSAPALPQASGFGG